MKTETKSSKTPSKAKPSEAAVAYRTRHRICTDLRLQADIDFDAVMETKPANNSRRRKISSRAKQVRRTSTMPPKSVTSPHTFGSQSILLEEPIVLVESKLALSPETDVVHEKAQVKVETSQSIVHIQAIVSNAYHSKDVVQEMERMQVNALEEARTSQVIIHIQATRYFQPKFQQPQEINEMQDDSEELDDAKEIEEDEKFVQVIKKEPEVCTCFIEEKADLACKLEAEEAYAEYCKKYWIWSKGNENLNEKVVNHNIHN
ncbi:hypothetical protein HK096_006647 [Nowakowskiella sp. JEL0078]|nr:hypothetical protein HK096_006647 [Nowakowskiella sp. JEL0078]